NPLREAAEVCVAGGVAVLVPDLDHVPVPARSAGGDDGPVAHGPNRRTRGGGVIDAVVRAAPAQNRVEAAQRERGADPAELQGGLEEGAARRLTVALVVFVRPVLARETIGLVVAPIDVELHRQDAPGAGR